MSTRWLPILGGLWVVGLLGRNLSLHFPMSQSLAGASHVVGQVPSAPSQSATGQDGKKSDEGPRPLELTNCVRCHLTAGRELTAPVHYFAGSIHDRAKLSCNDCHGGNTEDDTAAHEPEFGFIGTKISAHMAACADCHAEEYQVFRKGAHFWDLSKRINRDYPVCIDCHGNHDVGKPPADFSLVAVCTDCHKKFESTHPEAASIVKENDRLWQTLRRVQSKGAASSKSLPGPLQSEVGRLRRATAKHMHSSGAVAPEDAALLNERVQRLREAIERWLESQE